VTLQPDNPILHFRRAMALAELGQRQAAADAYRLALVFEPPASVAQLAMQALAFLEAPVVGRDGTSATVPLEPSRGVWVVAVVLNGERQARFLVDTGSSVTVVAPALANHMRLHDRAAGASIELQTLAGLTSGPVVTVASLRVGGVELRELPVVVHDPGPAVDGILGNTFLNRFLVTVDADRRLLHLRPLN
jgi:clan AA aspartic protease (TIGR02281 family)